MARPLEGKRIMVTRAAGQAESFAQAIFERGGEPVMVPVIAFREPHDPGEIDTVLKELPSYNWIIFTSANGVQFFFQILRRAGLEFPVGARTAVVGRKTLKKLEDFGVNADVVPDEYIAESLLHALKSRIGPGDKVLMPRGNLARKKLPEQLAALGFEVTDLTVYETVLNRDEQSKLIELLSEQPPDVITFTSSSTVINFLELLEGKRCSDLLEKAKMACIGPVTAETARDYGLIPEIVPDEYSTSGLLDAIEQFYEDPI
ncbi:MAG TPA: uroporphyrinogen-III synthase [Bacillales bacterium]|nr:uroporphyrinogen-III synthase [Bacillales bacterium]